MESLELGLQGGHPVLEGSPILSGSSSLPEPPGLVLSESRLIQEELEDTVAEGSLDKPIWIGKFSDCPNIKRKVSSDTLGPAVVAGLWECCFDAQCCNWEEASSAALISGSVHPGWLVNKPFMTWS